jgi:hypothetical protein
MSLKEVSQVIERLKADRSAHIDIYGSPLSIGLFDEAHKLTLSTVVFHGSNFIPLSVRACLNKKDAPIHPSALPTYITVDEQNSSIILNYIGRWESVTPFTFDRLLDEFCWLAEEWRSFLDEHGRQDLVHIYHKK